MLLLILVLIFGFVSREYPLLRNKTQRNKRALPCTSYIAAEHGKFFRRGWQQRYMAYKYFGRMLQRKQWENPSANSLSFSRKIVSWRAVPERVYKLL